MRIGCHVACAIQLPVLKGLESAVISDIKMLCYLLIIVMFATFLEKGIRSVAHYLASYAFVSCMNLVLARFSP